MSSYEAQISPYKVRFSISGISYAPILIEKVAEIRGKPIEGSFCRA